MPENIGNRVIDKKMRDVMAELGRRSWAVRKNKYGKGSMKKVRAGKKLTVDKSAK